MSKILLVGEQVTASGVEIKGFDYYGTHAYKEDAQALVGALKKGGHKVDWMRTCMVQTNFPEQLAQLRPYDVIILSDVGTNSLLFHPEMLRTSVPHPNRLTLIRDYVAQGGGLVMVGGWMSFAGIDGRARYHDTPVEEALPVKCLPYDDRQEKPEGIIPKVTAPRHPVLKRVPAPWPFFLGYNRVTPKKKTEILLKVDTDPLMCVWNFGKGRSAAFMSDCAPHWGPEAFLGWRGYEIFWNNLVAWLE